MPNKPPVMTSVKETLLRDLRNRGFRMTPQRQNILDVFYQLPEGDHLSAEEVYHLLQGDCSDISLATTYRTLKLFVSVGVLRELDFSEDHKHYEMVRDEAHPHQHVICVGCGKTAEFDSPEVQQLAERIAREKNLILVDVQLKIFTQCENGIHDASFQDHESLKRS